MTIFEDKVRQFSPRLQSDLSINKTQASGIFGNIGTETAGFTALQEIAPVVKGSRGGYGWLQWTGPRRKKYEAWAHVKGLNQATDEANYQYLVHECLGDEMPSLIALRQTKTLNDATETFMKKNLRPGVPALKSRQVWAKKADAVVLPSGAGAAGFFATLAMGVVATITYFQEHLWLALAGVTVGALLIGGLINWYNHRKSS